MDNGYVEVWFTDGNMLRIKCEEVEAALRTTEQSLAKLHRLLDNKPIEYVAMALSVEMQAYCDIELTPVEFKKAYATFRRFCLIDYSDDITKEDGAVRLYPSLQFCLDIGQLRQVMAEFVEQEDFEAADMADLEEAESEESDE